jgi:hypothetical protein
LPVLRRRSVGDEQYLYVVPTCDNLLPCQGRDGNSDGPHVWDCRHTASSQMYD